MLAGLGLAQNVYVAELLNLIQLQKEEQLEGDGEDEDDDELTPEQ